MSKYSDEWNKLPREVRTLGVMTEIEMRINQLLMERARTEKHYRAHIKEIHAHIKNLRESYSRNEKTPPAAELDTKS